MKQVYQAADGVIFNTSEECEAYERLTSVKESVDFAKALTCYSIKNAVTKYGLSKQGVWELRGEDPNCDLGGHHYQPLIGHFKGSLEAAIRYAVRSKNFYTWGGGGSVELINIVNEKAISN